LGFFMVLDTGSTGARLRERRIAVGLKQAELAEKVGISASYLNLIEHNRRRIAGKLLINLANALNLDPAILSEGAQSSLVGRLQECASHQSPQGQVIDRAVDFATRFPRWAELTISLDRKLRQMEQTVDVLNDRLSHDPHLATSLHEVLTTVTAIRSTSSILAETDDIAPEWRTRFHRNLNEDSHRLTEGAQALVSYLDTSSQDTVSIGTPWDELDGFWAAHDYCFDDFDHFSAADWHAYIAAAPELMSAQARSLATDFANRYRDDASQIPKQNLIDAVAVCGFDAVQLAQTLRSDIPTVMRRLAFLSQQDLGMEIGLACCDASGSFIIRKPVAGFHIPRFGSACALWPIFAAIGRPMAPISMVLRHTGREGGTFDTISYAEVQPAYDTTPYPMTRSYMLIIPRHDSDSVDPLRVGAACRVCARNACPARREGSILGHQGL